MSFNAIKYDVFLNNSLSRIMAHYLYMYLNWQHVLGTPHASAHGGSSDLIVKMLD